MRVRPSNDGGVSRTDALKLVEGVVNDPACERFGGALSYEEILSSGDYRRGFCCAETWAGNQAFLSSNRAVAVPYLSPGEYVIIISTFTAGE